MRVERFVHGGNVYEPCGEGRSWLDFSANINPLGLAEHVRTAILSQVEAVVHYPDPQARKLRAALSAHYEVSQDALVLGNGAAELFYLYFHALQPQRVLLPVPSFSEYERAALAVGSGIEYLPLPAGRGFSLSAAELFDGAQRTGADVLILGNPNNPTGTKFLREDLVWLSEHLTSIGCGLVVDESFLDFRRDEERYTLRHEAARLPHLLLIRSLTKFFALPGLRLGFAVAQPSLVRRLERHKDVWNVNVLAQAAGCAALCETAYQEKTRALVEEESAFLTREIAALPDVHVYPSGVNFLLVSFADAEDAAASVEGLRRRGILVRDCSNYPGMGRGFLRVAVRKRKENERLLAAWRAVLQERTQIS
ncbi:threonine-phosphate decarboxylase CobD [Selenomonas sp.]|jgi:threonine-phosphate decarboxylase|uniref:threonine-phosphate decarboxylase CobD n=1 Tax=Selenomonas sp. TaxID=2053611 RepID=UPI003A100600